MAKKKTAKPPEKNKGGRPKNKLAKDGRVITDRWGRPTVVTEAVLLKLEQAFAIGATDAEACFYAGISEAPLYKYQKENPDFAERKEHLKQSLVLKARKTIADDIGKPDTAKWYLERKLKSEFSTRVESTGKDGKPLLKPVRVNFHVIHPKNRNGK